MLWTEALLTAVMGLGFGVAFERCKLNVPLVISSQMEMRNVSAALGERASEERGRADRRRRRGEIVYDDEDVLGGVRNF